MDPATTLILAVASLIAVNRAYTGTALRFRPAAYVAVQLIDVVACLALVLSTLEGYPRKLDLSVRTFLVLFVAYHMVQNNQGRIAAQRELVEQQERDARLQDRRERVAAADAAQPPD